ncbi:MAG TPA: HD domain-containing protein [Aggregatilineales bacterium]|nr:HD domain-containing protein [Aggregatilineales bacterium]
MKEIDFKKVRDQVLARMEAELPSNLYYHGVHHTRDDVLPAAERLGAMAGLSDTDIRLLQTAAVYHDIGYTWIYDNHEALSASIVSKELPELGYTPEQVQKIVNMIMATRMPQNPQTQLESILCDADLSSLGAEDFFVKSQCLRLEMHTRGIEISVRDWYERQLEFLQEHTYFTEEAHRLRGAGKEKNIEELRRLLKTEK